MQRASFLPHGFDPEVHRPVSLGEDDRGRYDCDVSFIGTWSPKKQELLEHVAAALPDARMRIWGSQWEQTRGKLGSRVEGRHVLGAEYAKALVGSRVNLGILSEAKRGASSGDRITSRTFHIPATGAFMLHERTDELLEYFREDVECGCFETAGELVERIQTYLDDAPRREAIASAGLRRSVEDGYSVDNRAATVVAKARALATGGQA
jgi:spore maturation protein CgeB